MTPEKKTLLYLTGAAMGGIASVLLLCATVFDWPDFWQGACIGVLVVSLVLLLFRRLRDEYIEELWRAGASAAFLAVVACFVFVPLLEGLYDGVADREWPASMTGIVAIVAFFLAFHVKWLRGAR